MFKFLGLVTDSSELFEFGFDPKTDVFGFCWVFWCHSDSLMNGTKKMVHDSEGTERCLIFMSLRLGPFCVLLLDLITCCV